MVSDPRNRSLLTVLVIGMTGVFLHALRDVLTPLFLAFFLSYLGAPVLRLLARARVPNRLALVVVLSLFAGILVGLGALVLTGVQEIQAADDRYQKTAEDLIVRAEHAIRDFELSWRRPPKAVESASDPQALVRGEEFSLARELSESLSPRALLSTFGSLAGAVADCLFVLVFLVFILADRANRVMDRRMIHAFSSPGTDGARQVIESIHRDIEAYITLKTLVSIATGGLTAIALHFADVPYALLFGFIAFLLNYIPTIGSIAGAILPTSFALLHHADDPWLVLGLGLVLGLVQVAVGNFIEPWLMGKRLGLNPLTILIGLVVWGFLWGVWGMVLSVPLMVALRSVLEKTDTLPSVRILMSSD